MKWICEMWIECSMSYDSENTNRNSHFSLQNMFGCLNMKIGKSETHGCWTHLISCWNKLILISCLLVWRKIESNWCKIS